ncbi:MAG: sigma-70 family RNA polymerase sigma factor [Myxococcota bacterium]|nr:sigma-70 family RNA polymerase sigma factor [Myxococcota bacterium]
MPMTKQMSEKRLIKRLIKQDPRAFEVLVHKYQGPVFNLIYRMIGNREEAEDLAQEVFVTVFKKISTFRGDASLATWIYRIATNTCKNRKKYLSRRCFDRPALSPKDEYPADEALSIRTSGCISRPDEEVEGYEMEQLLQKAFGSLEEDHRLILVLRDIQGISYDDITTITGLPLGTVKSRLHRARLSLKEAMKVYLR